MACLKSRPFALDAFGSPQVLLLLAITFLFGEFLYLIERFQKYLTRLMFQVEIVVRVGSLDLLRLQD